MEIKSIKRIGIFLLILYILILVRIIASLFSIYLFRIGVYDLFSYIYLIGQFFPPFSGIISYFVIILNIVVGIIILKNNKINPKMILGTKLIFSSLIYTIALILLGFILHITKINPSILHSIIEEILFLYINVIFFIINIIGVIIFLTGKYKK